MTGAALPKDDVNRPYTVTRVAPCAEDEHQVQLEGRLPPELAARCFQIMAEQGGRVFSMGNNGSLVARQPEGAMFILGADCAFALSRIAHADAGLAVLDAAFLGG